MKASELIIDLQKMIDKHGDLPVYWTDDEWGGPMCEIEGFSVETPEDWKVKYLNRCSQSFMMDLINPINSKFKYNQVMDHDVVSTYR